MNDGPFCPGIYRNGNSCRHLPGEGTFHPGMGRCSFHERYWDGERIHTVKGMFRHRTWRSAVELAEQLDISPWEAMLVSVRLAARRVAWVDVQLSEVVRRCEEEESGLDNIAVRRWLAESRRERELLARFSAAAVGAGIQERYVQQIEEQGRLLARVVNRALDAVPDLPEEHRRLAIAAAFKGDDIVDAEVIELHGNAGREPL